MTSHFKIEFAQNGSAHSSAMMPEASQPVFRAMFAKDLHSTRFTRYLPNLQNLQNSHRKIPSQVQTKLIVHEVPCLLLTAVWVSVPHFCSNRDRRPMLLVHGQQSLA